LRRISRAWLFPTTKVETRAARLALRLPWDFEPITKIGRAPRRHHVGAGSQRRVQRATNVEPERRVRNFREFPGAGGNSVDA
jgi:hypothetical protein